MRCTEFIWCSSQGPGEADADGRIGGGATSAECDEPLSAGPGDPGDEKNGLGHGGNTSISWAIMGEIMGISGEYWSVGYRNHGLINHQCLGNQDEFLGDLSATWGLFDGFWIVVSYGVCLTEALKEDMSADCSSTNFLNLFARLLSHSVPKEQWTILWHKFQSFSKLFSRKDDSPRAKGVQRGQRVQRGPTKG